MCRGAAGVIRRIAARAVAKRSHDILRVAGAEQQFSLRDDGTGALHRLVTGLAYARPAASVTAVGISDAFSTVNRVAVVAACREHASELEPFCARALLRHGGRTRGRGSRERHRRSRCRTLAWAGGHP